jgi:hypothetical protein
MNLTVANPGSHVAPGVSLICYGPYTAPPGARSLVRFQPVVNMDLVHHLILFAGSTPVRRTAVVNSESCRAGNIIYAWARTGQATPQGLELGSWDGPAPGTGYEVGDGSKAAWFAVQIHYQNMGGQEEHDRSGVELAFTEAPPTTPLRLDVLMSTKVSRNPIESILGAQDKTKQNCTTSWLPSSYVGSKCGF